MRRCAWLFMIFGAGAAQAQMIADCEGSPLTAQVLQEASPDWGITYADGKLRIVDMYVDAHLPSPVLIGVLHPKQSDLADQPMYQGCTAIYSQRKGITGYFGRARLQEAEASYDPALGLTIAIPVEYHFHGRASEDGTLTLVINQALGTLEARED